MSGITKTGLLLGALVVASLAGCGKDQDSPEAGASNAPATAPPASAQAPAPAAEPAPPAVEAAAAEPATSLPAESAIATYAAAGLPDTLVKDGCYSCHDVNGARIGPPLRAVAGLYRTDPQAVDKLTQKIIHGGGGVWGPTPMIAHPQLSADQVRAMVEAILKLN
ncbi:c-type cytochrome [Immundisolibacter sp.]